MTDYDLEYQKNPSACGEPFPEIVAFIDKYAIPLARVLDLGCGQGRDAILIARRGHRVDGVDISPTGIEQMLSQARAENLQINGEVADIRVFHPEGNYDVVLLDRVIHMLDLSKEKEELLEKVKQATAAGGNVLIVDTPSNIPTIEAAFSDSETWQLVFRHKGFRFYQKAA